MFQPLLPSCVRVLRQYDGDGVNRRQHTKHRQKRKKINRPPHREQRFFRIDAKQKEPMYPYVRMNLIRDANVTFCSEDSVRPSL